MATPREGAGAPVPVEVDSLLIAAVRPASGGETLAWLVDSSSSVTYVESERFEDRLSGDRVGLELYPGVPLKEQRVTIANHLHRENRSFGGVLGVPFFRALTVSIDYDRGLMYVVRIPMTINGNPTEPRLAVDTSSRHTIVLNRRFVDDERRSDLRDRTVMVDQPVAKAKHFFLRAGSVSLGEARLKNVPVSVVQDPAIDAPLEVDGVIGKGCSGDSGSPSTF